MTTENNVYVPTITTVEPGTQIQQPAQQPCPSCGRCPCCGRGGNQLVPFAQPYYQPYPYYQLYTVTCSQNT